MSSEFFLVLFSGGGQAVLCGGWLVPSTYVWKCVLHFLSLGYICTCFVLAVLC